MYIRAIIVFNLSLNSDFCFIKSCTKIVKFDEVWHIKSIKLFIRDST